MTNGILLLVEETLNSVKQEHPQSQTAYEEPLINGKPPPIHPFIFDDINKELVRKAAKKRTEDGSSPSGLDTDEWRKMLSLKVFGSCTSDLPKAIADFIKHICIN